MYKLIASDLDGTLLRSDKTISQETIDTLYQLNAKGILFVPSTGRTHKELPKDILNLPFLHYGLCVNGGGIFDYKKNEYIYEKTIDKQTALDILNFSKTLEVYPSFVMKGNRYICANKENQILDDIKKIAVPSIIQTSYGCHDMETFIQESKQDVQKFLFYSKDESLTKDIVLKFSNAFPNLSICCSGPLYIEVNAASINKGNALQILCQHLQIDLQDTIAFGDASNDIDLLKRAGCAVAMSNGTEEVKQYADIIADRNDHDGLKKILQSIYHI